MERFVEIDDLYKYPTLSPTRRDIKYAISAEEGDVMNDWRNEVLNNASKPLLYEILRQRKVRYLFED